MKKRITGLLCMLLLGALATSNAQDLPPLPSFIDKEEVANFDCKCFGEEQKHSKKDQQYIDMLWDETLKYLQAYAVALTTSTSADCIDSDTAIYETADGFKKMCIMDQRDMQLMVKHIYMVLYNSDKAKKCFSARRDVDWIYSPGGQLEANSPVAQWADRTTFQEFFDTKVTDPQVKAIGKNFTDNFYEMVTGPEVKLPEVFPYDVSARSLPNLWAAAGWFPMYAEDSERNKKNFMEVRGGYAYAEIFGHWGLLRIDTINDEKVGAEVGMVAQMVGSFYPYHNHAISEVYYTMREPACVNQFMNFAIQDNNPRVKTVMEDDKMRRIQFDSGIHDEHLMWSSTSYDYNPLVYFHPNTIHAFEYEAGCETTPENKAMVTVWARSNAHDTRNDYGTTLLCEDGNNPSTPAKRGGIVQCDCTHFKY